MQTTTLAFVAVLLSIVTQPAAAADPAASFLAKLFSAVCVPNLGQPSKVRAWADAHHLIQTQNPALLGLFVGPGAEGAAWPIRTDVGSFAISIRGLTQACAIWAQVADPNDIQTDFKTIIEGVHRNGIVITTDTDKTGSSPYGGTHELTYNITAPNASKSFEFTMLTSEHSGGPFQASLQAALAGPHPATAP